MAESWWLSHGQHDAHGRAGARRAVDGHRAAQERDALAHAHQAQVLAALGTGDDPLDVEAPAPVAHCDQHRVVLARQGHLHAIGLGMLARIAQGLLHHTEDGGLHGRSQAAYCVSRSSRSRKVSYRRAFSSAAAISTASTETTKSSSSENGSGATW